ncbi:MAG: PKD domain-containing protein [Thermoplasmatota archaeon]
MFCAALATSISSGSEGQLDLPVADAGGPYSGYVGDTILFDGSGSYDPDGPILNYTWNFGDGDKGYGEITTHTYTSPGDYTVTLTVLSSAYETDCDATTAHITSFNWPPVADANGPYYGDACEPVEFQGCGSYDADGHIVSYHWNFGDGRTGSGYNPCHTYSSGGTYQVRLTVIDDDGASDTDTTYAYIDEGNDEPIADANGPYSGAVGETITFDGTDSYDPDGTITSYAWNFGDGESASGATPTHTYDAAGTYEVMLIVTDNDGATDSDVTVANIPGGNRPPTTPSRPSGPTTGNVWYSYLYTSYATDPDGDNIKYLFDWGDGSTTWTTYYASGEPASLPHSWDYQGAYNIRVKARDTHGAESNWSAPLPIAMPLGISAYPSDGEGLYLMGRKVLSLPTTIIIGPASIEPSVKNSNPLQQVDFSIDDTVEYTASEAPYSWTINKPLIGTHTLSVTATDKEGNSVTDSLDITFFILLGSAF